ncbi:MAG TPA: hypothetical protein DET40_12045 [Lentisphaeria bacterium]|nr:MAG: hypothetical protein A2X45_07600 [Lentisphaerae bacterium GWF2_50_93]HCE44271.1 hypothetical protein [Lentisphaeria bacterium]
MRLILLMPILILLSACSSDDSIKEDGRKAKTEINPAEEESKTTGFFVSDKGNDQNPGTAASPFATLEKARDKIRELRKTGSLATDVPPIVNVRGRFELESSLKFLKEDSGTDELPLIFRASQKDRAVLSGGRRITNFKPVTNQDAIARFKPEAKGKVLQADLKELGISDLGTLSSRGFGRKVSTAHMELLFDNAPMTLARYPNEGGYLKISGYAKPIKDEWKAETGDLSGGFLYKDDRPKKWKADTNIWVHGFWSWDWANSVEHVESLDSEKGFVRTSAPYGLYNFRKGQRFYFLNVLEELDAPGEYYIDREKGILYFWPPSPIGKSEAFVSINNAPVVSFDHAENIRFENFVVEDGRSHGVNIVNGKNITIAGCKIRNVGNRGINVNGGTNHGIISCDVYNTGDGGISIDGGNRKTLVSGGHKVHNCHIHHMGRWSKCYQAGISMSGVGLSATNNLIHDGPHNAILFNGNDMTIEYNEIHNVCLETGDVGAVYTGRDYTYRGNKINYNFIHDIGGVGMGSMGIYMDDCVSGTEIKGNILKNSTRAVFLGGGRDFKVENNIFINCKPAIHIDGRGIDKNPVWVNMVTKFMKDRLKEIKYHEPPYSTRYPEIADVDKYYEKGGGVPPENIVIKNNICVGGEWLKIEWNAKPECAKVADNTVNLDPGFVDPEKGNYLLKDDSPALKTGFKQIPFEKIGLQRNK